MMHVEDKVQVLARRWLQIDTTTVFQRKVGQSDKFSSLRSSSKQSFAVPPVLQYTSASTPVLPYNFTECTGTRST